MKAATPTLEESCSGMKSDIRPVSESINIIIITTTMRIKSFLLSNLEIRENRDGMPARNLFFKLFEK
jgi:hypothetical protein